MHTFSLYQVANAQRKRLELHKARLHMGVEISSGIASADHVRLTSFAYELAQAKFYASTRKEKTKYRARSAEEVAKAFADLLSGIDSELTRIDLGYEYGERLKALRSDVIAAQAIIA